jgi:hypothetical protein
LLCKVFRENKKLNLELESVLSEIASLRFVDDDMSVKPCDNCNMIMVNYADLWLAHSLVVSLLDGFRLKLRELKAHFSLLGTCTSCPLLRSDLEGCAVEMKDLKHQIAHSSRYSVLSPLCEMCGSLKGKLFYATKENTELKQEVAYLIALLEKIKLSEKIIEDDLSRVLPNLYTNWVLGLRDVRKRMRRILISLFLAPTTTKRRKHLNQSKPTTHPIQSHHSTQKEK